MSDGNVPRLRFPGFTDPWEQRKLEECFTERRESMPDGELISVTIGEGIKKFSELGRYDNSNEDKSKYKKVCVGDIAYNSMRMWQGASGWSPYEGIVSPAYTVLSPIKEVVDSKCISYLFKRTDMIQVFQSYSQGITSDNWNLKYPELSEIDVMISPYLEEQHQIARYLNGLDNLVTLYQRECEKWKELKKSLLQKMFPKEGDCVPEMRFRDFEKEWREYKLKDLLVFQNGFNGNRSSFHDGTPLISVMDVLDDGFITYDSVRGKASLSEVEKKRYIVEYGDVLFQRSSENFEDAGTSNVYLDNT